MEKDENYTYKRYYTFHEDTKKGNVYSQDDILSIIKNNGNFMIISEGGNGKTYLSKKWESILSVDGYKRIVAQEIDLSNLNDYIKDKIIIDNLDEIYIEDAKKIISYISLKSIKNVIIFSRPESIVNNKNPLFKVISFRNEKNINPRYKEYNADEDLFKGLNNHFSKSLDISQVEYEFISILSFKLLAIGRIDIYKEDLYEFTRIFNINNNTLININELVKKNIFVISNDEEHIFFKDKTIASFFSIFFFKKFAHIKNSYISFFNNFYSQVAFSETGSMLKKMKKDGEKIAWNMIKNNDFIFPFISFFKATDGLDDIFKFGMRNSLRDDFTLTLSRAQTFVSNDDAFNGSFYFSDYDFEIWNSINFKKYFEIMQNSIINEESLQRVNYLFLNWAKHALTHSKDKTEYAIVKKLANQIKNTKIIDKEYVRKWNVLAYIWEIGEVNSIKKNDYINYIGPIETALCFFISFNQFKSAIQLLKNVGFEKFQFIESLYSDKSADLMNFLLYLYKNNFENEFIRVWTNLCANEDFNEELLKQIGISKFIELICNDLNNEQFEREHLFFSKSTHEEMSRLAKNHLQRIEIEMKINVRVDTEKDNKITINVNSSKLKKDLMNLNFEPYIIKDSFNNRWNIGRKITEFTCNDPIEKNFFDEIFELIKNKFDKHEDSYLNLIKLTDPIIQIISKFQKINIENVHPVMLLFSNFIDLNDNLNYFDIDSKNHWSQNISQKEKKELVVSEFSNVKLFEKVVDDYGYYYLKEYIFDILERMNKDDRNIAIGLIYSFNKNYESWTEVYIKFKELENSKIAIEEFNWEPKNLYEFFNDSKSMMYQFKNPLSKSWIQKMIDDLFNSNFTIFKNEKKIFNTVEWYDNFFFYKGSKSYDDKLINLLYENEMLEWFISIFTKNALSWLDKYNDTEIHFFIALHLYKLTYLLSTAEAKEMINNFIENAPKGERDKIKRSWLSISKSFPGGSKELNVHELYRYLNDDLNQVEFYHLFKKEIVPIIEDIAQKVILQMKTKATETEIHKEINKTLPEILIKNYSIIYQPESNPFVPNNAKKRIDFILTKNFKTIIVELKTTNSIGINKKFSMQLNNYSQNQILPTMNCVIVFETKKISKQRKIDLLWLANSQNFDLLILKTNLNHIK